MGVFVVSPLVIVTFFAFTARDGGFGLDNFLQLRAFAPVFARSFYLAFLATAVCLLLGYPFAYALSRESARVQGAALLLVMLPMWMNFLLRTYAWMNILENNGLINRFLGNFGIGPLQLINTQGAVVLGMVYNYLPFMILPVFTVIQKIHASLIEAAQDLGGNARVVFARVVFPLSLPGVLSGITMVFVPSASTFIISKLLGGGKVLLLGDLIEMQFLGNAYNLHLGSAISIVMMLLVVLCMTVMNRFGDRGDVIYV
ncbi:MAG: ABC transporter permease [Oscillospiraceae bacterium]|jgi:spermidine/putrescine transport system permease protein|nr:ABC transporter permease [Oscillospiraceae bacterium]